VKRGQRFFPPRGLIEETVTDKVLSLLNQREKEDRIGKS
jgi:hypothetical protein